MTDGLRALARRWRPAGALLGLLLAGLVAGSLVRGSFAAQRAAAPALPITAPAADSPPVASSRVALSVPPGSPSSAPASATATPSAPGTYAAPSASQSPVASRSLQTTPATDGSVTPGAPAHGAGGPGGESSGAGPSSSGPGGTARTTGPLASVDGSWARRTATATGIPEPALVAYGAATIRAAREFPACRLGWTTLAGIGSVESDHGRTGGGTLLPSGITSRLILGPALDGRGGTKAIPATPRTTAMHGDPVWDHAVGPMQFIPSSWARYGADGGGDGVADPHDINDAAWAAARHLCGTGTDMSTGPGWSAAVLGYNQSSDYLLAVFERAQTYAERAR